MDLQTLYQNHIKQRSSLVRSTSIYQIEKSLCNILGMQFAITGLVEVYKKYSLN
jgi:hypothetical protein